MPSPELPSLLSAEEQQATEQALLQNLGEDLPMVPETARQTFLRQHEPLRTALLLRTLEVLEGPLERRFDLAAVLEYLSCATGLHHRVRSMSTVRRQGLKLDLQGTETSVLLGDYLLSVSFHTLTQWGQLDLLDTVSAATQQISRGQVLELSESWLDASVELWEEVVRCKFAALFGAAARMAAISAARPQSEWEAWTTFGERLGLAVRVRRELRLCRDPERLRSRIQRQDLLLPVLWLARRDPEVRARLEAAAEVQGEVDTEALAKGFEDAALDAALRERRERYWSQGLSALPAAYLNAPQWRGLHQNLQEES